MGKGEIFVTCIRTGRWNWMMLRSSWQHMPIAFTARLRTEASSHDIPGNIWTQNNTYESTLVMWASRSVTCLMWGSMSVTCLMWGSRSVTQMTWGSQSPTWVMLWLTLLLERCEGQGLLPKWCGVKVSIQKTLIIPQGAILLWSWQGLSPGSACSLGDVRVKVCHLCLVTCVKVCHLCQGLSPVPRFVTCVKACHLCQGLSLVSRFVTCVKFKICCIRIISLDKILHCIHFLLLLLPGFPPTCVVWGSRSAAAASPASHRWWSDIWPSSPHHSANNISQHLTDECQTFDHRHRIILPTT